jgi:hypothetical protein
MRRAVPILPLVVAIAACGIDEIRDGIGAACVVDGPPCPRDHVCLADDGQPEGLCAPVLDYGATCVAPTYAQVATETLAEPVDVNDADGLGDLEGVTRVEGDVRIDGAVGTTLALTDLCRARGLQQVTGSLLVASTDLTTLDGLQGLSFVGQGIGVAANRDLVDLTALTTLVRVGPALDRDFAVVIADNTSLPPEPIAALRAALAGRPSIVLHVCGNARALGENDANVCGPEVNALLRRE